MHYLDYSEKIQHGTPDFPLAYYYVDEKHPRYHMPMHWHREVELLRVLRGRLRLYADNAVLTVEAGALAADVKDAPAAVWAIALDGLPLAETRRVLLVHATNVESTGIRTLDLPNSLTVFDHGRLPFLMRRGTADVSLAVSRGAWKAYALSPGGRRRREVPCRFDDHGRMRLLCNTAADPSNATFAYELSR